MTLTVEEFRQVLPDKMKKSISQALMDQINTTLTNPEEFEHYRNNLISYTSVMRDGKFKIEQYLDAVRFVSFKLLGATNIEAYMKTFPDKYNNFVATGVSAKDIASYVTAYNKGKLINLIFEQTMIPVHVMNMDMYQRALNEQMVLGLTAKSEKVRADALNSVMVQLRPPETKKLEMDITVKEDQSLNVLKNSMMELVAEQRRALQSGSMNAQQVAHQKLEYVDVEAKEVP